MTPIVTATVAVAGLDRSKSNDIFDRATPPVGRGSGSAHARSLVYGISHAFLIFMIVLALNFGAGMDLLPSSGKYLSALACTDRNHQDGDEDIILAVCAIRKADAMDELMHHDVETHGLAGINLADFGSCGYPQLYRAEPFAVARPCGGQLAVAMEAGTQKALGNDLAARGPAVNGPKASRQNLTRQTAIGSRCGSAFQAPV